MMNTDGFSLWFWIVLHSTFKTVARLIFIAKALTSLSVVANEAKFGSQYPFHSSLVNKCDLVSGVLLTPRMDFWLIIGPVHFLDLHVKRWIIFHQLLTCN